MSPDEQVTVLLVEDDPVTAAVMTADLQGARLAQFRVQTAVSLADALSALELRRFDVLILDLGLPDAFGLQAVQAIVQHPCAVPSVVASASDDAELAQATIELGAQDYFTKGRSSPQSLAGRLLAARARHARLRRESERSAELLALVEDLPDGHLLLDDEDRVIVANRKAGELYGREADWLVGQRFRAVLTPNRDVILHLQPASGGTMTVVARTGFVRWQGRRVRVVALRPVSDVGAHDAHDAAAPRTQAGASASAEPGLAGSPDRLP